LGVGSVALPEVFKAFGYGGKLVRDGDIEGGEVIRVLLAVIMASTGIGSVCFCDDEQFSVRCSFETFV
jgi:hypothetical protein